MKMPVIAALAALYIPAHAATVVIPIQNFAFGDANNTVVVNVGDTVQWTNMDAFPHTVTSGLGTPDGKFDAGNLNAGASYSVTFRRAGMFPYYCQYHESMVSAIQVLSPAQTVTVTVAGTSFGTANATTHISAGDSVKWVWVNGSHTVTSGTVDAGGEHPDGTFNSALNLTTTKFQFQFNSAGTFPYYCAPHGVCCGMHSSVVVGAGTVFGDVNGSGTVDAADAAAAIRIWAGLDSGTQGGVTAADVYPTGFGDGKVDLMDAMRIIRFVSGQDTTPL